MSSMNYYDEASGQWKKVGITVPAVTHVNGKSGDVVLTADDVDAIPAIEDINNPGCYYRMVDGEKEWVNPPMVKDVAYRTTKRKGGKAVYRLLAYYKLGDITSEQIVIANVPGLVGADADVFCTGSLGVYVLPYFSSTSTVAFNRVGFPGGSGNVEVVFRGPGTDWRGYTLTMNLEFTRP